MDNYLYLHSHRDKSKILYTIWIGANNYIKAPSDAEGITTSAVDAIGSSIERLIDNGASKFFILNIPDIGKSPEARESNTTNELTELTMLHNRKLKIKVDAIKVAHPEVKLVYLDIESIFEKCYQNPQKYNIHHVVEACYNGGYIFKANQQQSLAQYLSQSVDTSKMSMTASQKQALLDSPVTREALRVAYLHEQGEEPLDCSDYLFWDHLHPTTVVHKVLAQFAIEAIDKSGLVAEQD